MWEFLLRQLLNQAARTAGGKAAGQFFNDEANGPEAYADRIKRDFGLQDYADAWKLYNSDRAYWERYYSPPPEPDWNSASIQDSAAAAGVPSRNNVFEYGFPESGPALAPSGEVPPDRRSTTYLPMAPQQRPGGLPGMMAEAGLIDPSNPDQPPPGGLPGLIQEWMRNNPDAGANR